MSPASRSSDVDPPSRPRRRRFGLLRALSWHRRWLAAVCAVVAVGAGLQLIVPPPAPTVTVVAARVGLPGGRALTAADLTTVRLPPDAVPDHAVADPAAVTGRVLAAPLTARQVVTESAVVSPRMGSGEPGTVIVPVRLADADVIALLAVGDRIDILATDPQLARTEIAATGARIVVVPTDAGADGPLGADTGGGGLVLVEVDAITATRLATAAGSSRLTVVWRGPG